MAQGGRGERPSGQFEGAPRPGSQRAGDGLDMGRELVIRQDPGHQAGLGGVGGGKPLPEQR